MKKTIFTVGHSTHTIDYFLELINAHAVNCVVDVRSVAAKGGLLSLYKACGCVFAKDYQYLRLFNRVLDGCVRPFR